VSPADQALASTNEKHLVFSEDEFRARLQRVRDRMEASGLSCLVVLDAEDIYYLTGFRSWGFFEWQALIVPSTSEPVMVSRALEERMYHDNSWIDSYHAYRDHQDPVAAAASIVADVCPPGEVVGLPDRSRYLSADAKQRLQGGLRGVTWVDSTDLIGRIRWIKSPAELDAIRKAGALTSESMRSAVDAAAEGKTENDVIAEWFRYAVGNGSEVPAMGPYIGTGVRSAFGHSSWENNVLRRGDVIFFEASACINRYSAPLMRTIAIGQPAADIRSLEEASLAGADAAIASIRPGVTAGDVDAAGRTAVRELGMDEFFRHRMGYSVGIGFTKWLDGFSLRPHEETVLQENMVLHVIPFLSTGREAVALSETVRVTATGAERIPRLDRSIFVR
jgi:Xaa-Pro aminopeptidase